MACRNLFLTPPPLSSGSYLRRGQPGAASSARRIFSLMDEVYSSCGNFGYFSYAFTVRFSSREIIRKVRNRLARAREVSRTSRERTFRKSLVWLYGSITWIILSHEILFGYLVSFVGLRSVFVIMVECAVVLVRSNETGLIEMRACWLGRSIPASDEAIRRANSFRWQT